MLLIKFFSHCLVLISVAFCITEDNTKQKEIELLEKEKSDLLKHIHIAIDDSVTLLKQDNNTQNAQGVLYMLQLKQQLQFPNDTNKENEQLMEEDSNSELENRRKMKNFKSTMKVQKPILKTRRTTTFDINKVLYGKKLSADKLKELLENRVLMQKRLDEWILQRELEKAKIRERHLANQKLLQSGMLEKCPRFGYRKKKKNFRRAKHIRVVHRNTSCKHSDISGEKKHRRKQTKYPCCRKCCKKSYMGCL